jgi:hypothetical protein
MKQIAFGRQGRTGVSARLGVNGNDGTNGIGTTKHRDADAGGSVRHVGRPYQAARLAT